MEESAFFKVKKKARISAIQGDYVEINTLFSIIVDN